MRRIFVILLLVPCITNAQDKSLSTPLTFSNATKVVINTVSEDRKSLSAAIRIGYQDASGNDIPDNQLPPGTQIKFAIPSAAGQPCTSATTFGGLEGARNVTRSGETGANARIQQFRVLGYLSDQGCLPAGTVNP